MSQSIIKLARQEGWRRDLAQSALRSAERFHIDSVGAKWLELFEAEVPQPILRREVEES